jgi:thymidylate synthase
MNEYNENTTNHETFEHDEKQYLKLISSILEKGYLEEGRNGNTISLFGSSMRFSLENNIIPILTTKKVAWKTCLKELLWFIKGSTDNEILIQNGVKIWNGNSSRSYLDSIGLINNKENDLGPVYGHQWRHFNATYVDNKTNYNGKGIDQLQNIIDLLKNPSTRNSRRIILSSWNPLQLDQMALPPCHILAQFNVHGGNKLSCALYQRSGDIGLGVPFNILSYSLLTHLLAKHCDLIPYEFVHFIGNTHIYDDHIEPLKQQIKRVPFNFPTIEILHKYDDINKYTLDDFIIKNYQYYDKIPMEMRN